MRTMRKYLWMGALAFGAVFLALGIFFVVKGIDARAQITAGLLEEQIKTSKDGVQFGAPEGTLVTDARTALVQANTIKLHTLGAWGPYSQMARTDPNRATYLNGVALRTALNVAVMGYGVADLAIGAGAVIILMGAMIVGLGAPALYWAKEAEGEVVREVSQRLAPAALAGGLR